MHSIIIIDSLQYGYVLLTLPAAESLLIISPNLTHWTFESLELTRKFDENLEFDAQCIFNLSCTRRNLFSMTIVKSFNLKQKIFESNGITDKCSQARINPISGSNYLCGLSKKCDLTLLRQDKQKTAKALEKIKPFVPWWKFFMWHDLNLSLTSRKFTTHYHVEYVTEEQGLCWA